jgi:hypothetical protein
VKLVKVWHAAVLAFILAGAFVLSWPGRTVIAGDSKNSGDAFKPIAEVLLSPRCVNCHPRDDAPRQGNNQEPHKMLITRGPDGLGATGARCYSCHQTKNSSTSIVPGAQNWHLAPLSMGWQGLSHGELCETLKDESKNGGKDLTELVEHMEKDELVLWGWSPGIGRDPVPVGHKEFVDLLKYWVSTGANCPAK